MTSISTEMDAKRLELLREVVPTLSHVAVLWSANSPLQALAEKQTQAAAHALKVKVLSLGVRSKPEIDSAFVVRILEGTHPGDPPVERPSAFELVINLRAARAMGLSVPQSVLLRATELIQ